jgi:hypothetical protein
MALAVRLRSESFFLDTGPLAWSSLEATTWVRCGTGVEPLPARALLATIREVYFWSAEK